MNRIETKGLSKAYGKRYALRDTSIVVESGQVAAVIGHNGAGKSTLFHLLCLRSRATAGQILVDGAPAEPTPAFRAAVGVVSHASFLYSALTGRENLELVARLYRRGEVEVPALLTRVGLERAGERRVREYSRGMVQRLSIARLLLQGARLWLLDEPATGLDERGLHWLEGEIRAAREAGGLVLVSSHHRDLLHATATHALVLSRGRLVHQGPTTPADIDALFQAHVS